MKVLLIFPQEDKRTGLYIRKAFQQLGHCVFAVDPKRQPVKVILDNCKTFKPDLTFCSRTPELSLIAKELKNNSGKLAMWNTDIRDTLDEYKPLFPLMKECDKFFTVGAEDMYRNAGFDNCHWLSQGIDPDIHKQVKITKEQYDKYKCDILFVGSYYSEPWNGRKRFLDDLLKWGKKENYTVKIIGAKSPQKNPFLNDVEANIAYQCVNINVGLSGWPNADRYTSVRDWKIMATGQYLFTRNTKNLDKVLPEACHKRFSDFSEFAKSVKHDTYHVGWQDRAKIILDNHTYKHRIKKALDIIFN